MNNRRTYTEFNVMMIFENEMISQLQVKYPDSSIDNWKGYLVQRLSLMLQSYQTFSQVLLQDKDYITANSVLRMMADNLAITKFIYLDHHEEMRLLRHYMFLLDGSLTFIKLTDSMEDVGDIIKEARERSNDEAQYIKGQITKLQLYKDNSGALDKLINIDKRVCNWKFRDFSDKKGLHFSELYKKLDIAPNIISYLEYLSQFAHGLGLYSLGTVASIQNVPFVLEMRDLLLGLLINYVYRLFPEHSYNNDNVMESLRTKLSHSEMELIREIANNTK